MHCRKLACLERLAYSEKSLKFIELRERKELEDIEKRIELISTKRRPFIIVGHGRWLDERTEQYSDNIKCSVKL